MSAIVECVPNFSEGRRPEIVDAIAGAISGVAGVALLDRHMDADHNRCVITFAGEADAVAEAAFRAAERAGELIDMRVHRGLHPRMGAADVVPFVPIRDATTSDCVSLARRVGQRIGDELGTPVYLYGRAATSESRRELSDVRSGEYEGLLEAIRTDPDRRPDFGPAELNRKSGATAVGVRPPLVAFNVYLNTGRVEVADAIARAIRFSSGGLRHVKALGRPAPSRHGTQVTMNLTDVWETPIYRVFAMIKNEAARWGVQITSSEIVGLAPARALFDCAAANLQLEGDVLDRVLEERVRRLLSEEIAPLDADHSMHTPAN
ncbi:MAG TPA: glutamate formimidoyltransferase [candidate division Zixibacteria bacterium]|jgi:glutamate formiminotransferase